MSESNNNRNWTFEKSICYLFHCIGVFDGEYTDEEKLHVIEQIGVLMRGLVDIDGDGGEPPSVVFTETQAWLYEDISKQKQIDTIDLIIKLINEKVDEESKTLWIVKLIELSASDGDISEKEKMIIEYIHKGLSIKLEISEILKLMTKESDTPSKDDAITGENATDTSSNEPSNSTSETEEVKEDKTESNAKEPDVASSGDPVEDYRGYVASKFDNVSLPKGKPYGHIKISRSFKFEFNIRKDDLTISFASYGPANADDVIAWFEQQDLQGTKLLDKYPILAEKGKKNPDVVRAVFSIPINDKSDLNSSAVRDEADQLMTEMIGKLSGISEIDNTVSDAIYKPNGKHVHCYYDEMFYETLGDNFQRDDSIVIVEVTGENFENFIDLETETEAYKIFENFSFKEIGYADYGDWDELSSMVGKEEVEKLRKIYFDCDDYAETTWTVLLYHNFTFVTLVRD